MKIIKIGLYEQKETGALDVMIKGIDNSFNISSGEYKLIKEFEHTIQTKEEILMEELESLQIDLYIYLKDQMNRLDDDTINKLRKNLYDYMCKRRDLKTLEKEK